MKTLFQRLLRWFGRDEELGEELEFHIQMRAEMNRASGMSEEHAQAEARRQFGNRSMIQEETRAVNVHGFLETIGQDVRYAIRSLGKSPGFATVAVLTLALGIGANTAVFQVLDAIVLRPLPVRDPQQLVKVQGYHNGNPNGFSYPLLREMNARQTTVEGIFASGFVSIRSSLSGERAPVEAVAVRVATGNYFRLLGTEPQHGRFFTEADDNISVPPVAVISHSYWRREFGGRSGALGQVVHVNGVAATIVGVSRPEFLGERVGMPVDIWLPLSFAGQLSSPGNLTASSIWLEPMARLRGDVPLEQARAELNLLFDQLKDFSIRSRGVNEYRLELLPGHQGLGTLHSQFSQSLWLLMAIVALLALLASCNLANLLLARATVRTREIAVRLAIGAGRARLVRQLLTESLVLSSVAGGFGLVLAALSSSRLVALASYGEIWRVSTSVDWRVFGFTALLSLGVACVFGLAPALTATKVGLNSALQGSGRTHTGNRSRRFIAKAFVVSQVALSFVLLAAALLLVRSFWNLTHQDFGFKAENVLVAELEGDQRNFRELLDTETRQDIYRRVNQIPGVVSAAVTGSGILGQWSAISAGSIALPDRILPESPGARIVPVSPRYVETMGISILRGRSINEGDLRNSPRVAVISKTAAHLMFGAADPIGKVFAPGTEFPSKFMFEVVGVMNDHRFASPREPFGSLVFVPVVQMPASGPPRVVLRVAGDPKEFATPLGAGIREVAPSLRIERLTLLQDLVRTAARQERLLAWLSGAFGGLGLLLASFGLYGVVSYSTERRTQEIGVRMALGARTGEIRRSVLAESLSAVAIGILVGFAATIATTHYLETLLFGLSPGDPVTVMATAACSMLVVAVIASYLPARRASRVDPLVALRYD